MPTVSILRRQLAAAATASKSTTPLLRTFATASAATPSALSSGHHKILIIGGGSAGISLASQLRATFASEGQQLADGDVAIVDGSREHHFQPGWTLVGAGLKDKESFAYSMDGVIPAGVAHIPNHASKFAPSSNKVTLDDGRELTYDHLVVAAGIKTRFDAVKGLEEALKDPLGSKVASIYSYETCDKTWDLIEALPKHSGSQKLSALFTQPFGPVKCAGAPQKINYMAWDRWRQTGRGDGVQTHFMTGMPTMFSVPHYSAALDALRKERGIEASFNTDLVEVRSEGPGKRVAIFKDLKSSNGARVEKEFDLLHVTPPMGPLDVIKNSELADAAGWVDVDQGTLQHKRFKNVFSAGDCSSLPTSKVRKTASRHSLPVKYFADLNFFCLFAVSFYFCATNSSCDFGSQNPRLHPPSSTRELSSRSSACAQSGGNHPSRSSPAGPSFIG